MHANERYICGEAGIGKTVFLMEWMLDKEKEGNKDSAQISA